MMHKHSFRKITVPLFSEHESRGPMRDKGRENFSTCNFFVSECDFMADQIPSALFCGLSSEKKRGTRFNPAIVTANR